MKKIIAAFLLTSTLGISMSVLSSCGQKETSKAKLDFGVYVKDGLKTIYDIPELTYDNLKSKIENKDSFILVPYNSGCGCWTDFAPVLVDFINKYHISVEYINIDKFSGGKNKFGLDIEDSKMPAVAIFSNGILQLELTYSSNTRDYFKDHRELYKFISENTYLPKQYYIDKGTLDSFIYEGLEFNLYVARTGCPDCAAADKDVLKVWNNKVETVSEPLYIFDLAPYYASAYIGSTDEEIKNYQYIKDMYGLSEKYNPILGYSTGMVPTFQRRKGEQITDMVTVLNDSQNEGVISSYFTETRTKNMSFLTGSTLEVNLDGMKIVKDDDELDWKQYWRVYKSEYYSKYHYPILNLFISTYVK